MVIKKLIQSKKGDGYIEVCVAVISFVMILVVAINTFTFLSIKTNMEQIADELMEIATYHGCFSSDFYKAKYNLSNDYFPFDVDVSADEYLDATYHKVQLGDRMYITVTRYEKMRCLGDIKIPITLKVKKSGISEKYWK